MGRQRPSLIPVFLSEDDLQVLRGLVDEQRNRVRNTTGRPKDYIQEQEQPAPETYLAWAYEGIPAAVSYREDTLTGTGTGSGTGTSFFPYLDVIPSPGEADIYQLVGGLPVRIGRSEIVYNTSTSAIAAGTPLMVSRDKFGSWFIVWSPSDAGSRLTVKEVDGLPSYVNTVELRFDQADGFTLSQPSAGVVRIDYTGPGAGLEVKEVDNVPDVTNVSVIIGDKSDAAGTGSVTVTDMGGGTVKLSIREADAVLPGILSTGTQNIGGAKTFMADVTIRGTFSNVSELFLMPNSATGPFGVVEFFVVSALSLAGSLKLATTAADGYLQTVFQLNQAGGPGGVTASLTTQDNTRPTPVKLNANYAVGASDGSTWVGAWNTTGGLTFAGGLYTGGTLTVSPGTGTGAIVGATSPIITDGTFNQAANGDTAITSKRFTDVTPTGNFEDFQTQAGASLWKVDVTGTLIAGTVPVARVSGFSTALDALGGVTANF